MNTMLSQEDRKKLEDLAGRLPSEAVQFWQEVLRVGVELAGPGDKSGAVALAKAEGLLDALGVEWSWYWGELYIAGQRLGKHPLNHVWSNHVPTK